MRRRADRTRPCAHVALLALLLALPCARAQDPAGSGDSALQSFRPTGPVTLTADRAEWVQGGQMQYYGNVSMRSDTLQLRGERMTVTQHTDGQFAAQLTGTPARLDHAGRPGTDGIGAQPVNAQAENIDYDSRTGVIRLSGGARLLRGSDEVTGEQIDYVVAERRIRAAGGQAGQVRIVIQPPARKSAAVPSPAPTASPAPGTAPAPAEPAP